jgi:hypothetical protein
MVSSYAHEVQDETLWVNVSMAAEKIIKGEGEVDWLVMVVEKEKLIKLTNVQLIAD